MRLLKCLYYYLFKGDISLNFKIKEIELEELGNDNTDYFSLKGYKTRAKCIQYYSSDDLYLVFFYHNKPYKWNCSLDSIGPLSKLDNIYLKNIIENKIFTIQCYQFNSKGRLNISIYLNGKTLYEILEVERKHLNIKSS